MFDSAVTTGITRNLVPSSYFKSALKLLRPLLPLLLLSACTRSFVVTPNIPSPLVEKMPITAKMVYSEEFRNYSYLEKNEDRDVKQVDLGAAQVATFDRVFRSLLNVVEPNATTYDLSIEPQMLDFEYSTPGETSLKFYEVFLKYRLKILNQEGAEVADWVVKGYGKEPTELMSSASNEFNAANNMALRDVGAQLAIGFPSQPSIEDFVASRANAGPSSPTPAAIAAATDEVDAQTEAGTGLDVTSVGEPDDEPGGEPVGEPDPGQDVETANEASPASPEDSSSATVATPAAQVDEEE